MAVLDDLGVQVDRVAYGSALCDPLGFLTSGIDRICTIRTKNTLVILDESCRCAKGCQRTNSFSSTDCRSLPEHECEWVIYSVISANIFYKCVKALQSFDSAARHDRQFQQVVLGR